MRKFRVYFSDGNQKLYEAKTILEVVNFIDVVSDYLISQVEKIEEVTE